MRDSTRRRVFGSRGHKLQRQAVVVTASTSRSLDTSNKKPILAGLFTVDSASGQTQCIKESLEVLERGIKKCGTDNVNAMYEAMFDYIEERLKGENEGVLKRLRP